MTAVTHFAKSFQSTTIAGLVAEINTFLAGLTGGSAITIIGLDIALADLDRYQGLQFSAFLSYDTSSPAAQTDPYVLELFDVGNSTDLETALDAWYVTNAAAFTTGIRNVSFPNNPSRLPRLTAWGVSCADATNGPTNWALI